MKNKKTITPIDLESVITPLYAAYETVNENRSPGVLIGVYFNKTDAQEAAKGKGYYGSDGLVKSIDGLHMKLRKFYMIPESMHKLIVVEVDAPIDYKERAKAKTLLKAQKLLTKEELELLEIC